MTLLIAFCSNSFFVKAQNPVKLLSNTPDWSPAILNCWLINSSEVERGGRDIIYVNDVTESGRGITSPWIKFDNTGKILLKKSFLADERSVIDFARLEVIKIDINNNKEIIYNHTFTSNSNEFSEILINFNGIYKIEFKFYGKVKTNQTSRIFRGILERISIEGEYWSSPSNNCAPKALVNNDTDGDLVFNDVDEFPNDPLRAFNITEQKRTVMFEDQWPKTGDYDLNDVVIEYSTTKVTNAQNLMVDMFIKVVTKALGASYSNGLIFQLDGIYPNNILSVSGSKLTGSGWVSLASNGIENNQTKANIIIFDNGNAILGGGANGNITNVQLNQPYFKPDTTIIKIAFDTSIGNSSSVYVASLINPYIIANQNRGIEVHLPYNKATDKADSSFFGKFDDDAEDLPLSFSPSFYRNTYITKNKLPWAIEIISDSSIPYMQEGKDLTTGFSKFVDWASSSGNSFANWYLDISGYRNNSNLYIR